MKNIKIFFNFVILTFSLLVCVSMADEAPFKPKPVSTSMQKTIIDALKSHKCDDGHTVLEVLNYTQKATGNNFILGNFDVIYDINSKPYASVSYFLKPKTQLDEDYSLSWNLSSDLKSVYSDISSPDENVLQSGELLFAMYMNEYLFDIGDGAYNRKLHHDTKFLSIISSVGFDNGIDELVKHFNLHITQVNISYIRPDLAKADDPRSKVGTHIEIFFDIPNSAPPEIKEMFKDNHAEWVKEPNSKTFKPNNPWAEHMSNDGINLSLDPPLYPNF